MTGPQDIRDALRIVRAVPRLGAAVETACPGIDEPMRPNLLLLRSR
jgi:hypothetical protein